MSSGPVIPACPFGLCLAEKLSHTMRRSCGAPGVTKCLFPDRKTLYNGEEERADHRKGHPVTRQKRVGR